MIKSYLRYIFSGKLENGEKSRGGGVIQGTASEASLVALLSARARAIW